MFSFPLSLSLLSHCPLPGYARNSAAAKGGDYEQLAGRLIGNSHYRSIRANHDSAAATEAAAPGAWLSSE
uniref:Putative secreted protein n=1 Tax=Anopheles darlingi TaxID=43151 RepID=A0A2M4DPU4_ANODA